MSFQESDHPRKREGTFTHKRDAAPATTLEGAADTHGLTPAVRRRLANEIAGGRSGPPIWMGNAAERVIADGKQLAVDAAADAKAAIGDIFG